MTQCFAALLLAHVLADFALQTRAMAEGKKHLRAAPMAIHAVMVLAATVLALGAVTPLAWGAAATVTAAHLAIDLGKSVVTRGGRFGPLAPFLADQALHLAVLALIAFRWPDLWAAGLWVGAAWLPALMALGAGSLVATRAGGFAVGFLMSRYAIEDLPAGLPEGGRLIGVLERGLILLLVLVNQPAGIGFLIAAKSVLRFDAARESTRAGEYVIIGTLASFGWALGAAYLTRALAVALGFPGAVP